MCKLIAAIQGVTQKNGLFVISRDVEETPRELNIVLFATVVSGSKVFTYHIVIMCIYFGKLFSDKGVFY